ncbi:thiJ/PfpI family protein [Klebsiella grimontii]|uniref:ThiJ/PfpI family protein n=1 Tax=Klebsiella grimontii TaxID=2058152 RepID=A0A7H4P4Y3_9ENTR|nr:thiJ/PfpI family protein [Klebsiella grimontii]
MMGKKILMLVGDYAEDYETMVPFPGTTNDWTSGCCCLS